VVPWSEYGPADRADGEVDTSVAISWVTIERWAREDRGPRGTHSGRPYRDDAESLTDTQLLEKLRKYGVELDRAGLQALCQDAFSAAEVASGLMSGHDRQPTIGFMSRRTRWSHRTPQPRMSGSGSYHRPRVR
jgi:hypothetical protein